MGALAQPSTELTEMSHKHCADLLASLVVSQLTSVVVMSSTTLNQSVTKILAKYHNINRVDALPEIIRRYPALKDKLQTTADGCLVSVLVQRVDGMTKTLVVLHTNQACYGCVPFRMDHIIEENYRNRASVVAVLATLLNSSPPGLDSDGNFDLRRASPGLMDGKKAAVTNASSFGPKGGVWRKIADEEAEVTEENKDGWIHCLVKILDGPILLAANKKEASISIGESKKKGEKVPTSVATRKLSAMQ